MDIIQKKMKTIELKREKIIKYMERENIICKNKDTFLQECWSGSTDVGKSEKFYIQNVFSWYLCYGILPNYFSWILFYLFLFGCSFSICLCVCVSFYFVISRKKNNESKGHFLVWHELSFQYRVIQKLFI